MVIPNFWPEDLSKTAVYSVYSTTGCLALATPALTAVKTSRAPVATALPALVCLKEEMPPFMPEETCAPVFESLITSLNPPTKAEAVAAAWTAPFARRCPASDSWKDAYPSNTAATAAVALLAICSWVFCSLLGESTISCSLEELGPFLFVEASEEVGSGRHSLSASHLCL
eukprot:TRINITY_DN2992_c0_g1_i1.p2 TRINITY_DN2992_c0_g1~~TRINITY_DN2992_c0_g1_i1.p2  ORF type:complete len:171 (-),score=28.13 TRINITY_DN2992_c0_g1_i1:433-945(-)